MSSYGLINCFFLSLFTAREVLSETEKSKGTCKYAVCFRERERKSMLVLTLENCCYYY